MPDIEQLKQWLLKLASDPQGTGQLGFDPRVEQSYNTLASQFAPPSGGPVASAPGNMPQGYTDELGKELGVPGAGGAVGAPAQPGIPIAPVQAALSGGGVNDEMMQAIEAMIAQSMNELAQRKMRMP